MVLDWNLGMYLDFLYHAWFSLNDIFFLYPPLLSFPSPPPRHSQTGAPHPKKEGFPPHSENFGWGWGMAILFSWMGIALLVAPNTPIHQVNALISHLMAQFVSHCLLGNVGAGFGLSWLKSVAFLSSISCHHLK